MKKCFFLSIIIFANLLNASEQPKFFDPLGIYKFIHSKAVPHLSLPAAVSKNGLSSAERAIKERQTMLDYFPETDWTIERIAIQVNRNTIDAAIITHTNNERWLLHSNGNDTFYEKAIKREHFKKFLLKLDCNAIVFNYPGVGESTGIPNRYAMAEAYRAMLSYLEEKKLAKQIIGYGHSIGGGVQAEALLTHKFKDWIDYVFVKDRSFSTIKQVATKRGKSGFVMGVLAHVFGWNIRSVESSKKLDQPEIIIQATRDRIIPEKASLAEGLKGKNYPKKHFLWFEGTHSASFDDDTLAELTTLIDELLDCERPKQLL